jgi:aminoglycoside 3-N-acetyltransferase
MLAACGPLASELLQDNLNDSKPLPHGIHSGYYRFCQRNGLVVSIGIPLRQCMTLTHAAEEVRDEQWPVKDFFKEKPYILQIKGQRKTCVVRETRVEYRMFCMCAQKMYRDLSGAGILHDGMVGTVHVGWARAGEVFQYLMTRNRNSSYPYYWPQLARRKA